MKEGVYLTKFNTKGYDDIVYATEWNTYSNEIKINSDRPVFEEPYEREEEKIYYEAVSCELILPKEYMT